MRGASREYHYNQIRKADFDSVEIMKSEHVGDFGLGFDISLKDSR